MKILHLIALPLLVASALHMSANDLSGTWAGQLKVAPGAALKLVFHIQPPAEISIDSPDQNAYGIPGEIEYLSTDSIAMKVPALRMSYTGRRNADSISGTFSQGGLSLPLILEKGTSEADTPSRPQTPQPPFPYTAEEVTVSHDGATLCGTLTIPEGASELTPAVVMVTGSGLQNRDEEIFGHRPFAVIADYLARRGIASLRYDDRGCGASKGDVEKATTADFADDARAVAEWLRRTGRFGRIGMLGHSEGGLIAYRLGSHPGLLDFVVSVAGPSVRGDSILLAQNANSLAQSGIAGTTASDFLTALSKAFQIKINDPDTEITPSLLDEIYPAHDSSAISRQLAASISQLSGEAWTPWMQYFIGYSPAADLSALSANGIPTLILYGENDTQVPASLNAPAARANAPGAEVRVYPALNHLMQHSVTGQAAEYPLIEETISPQVLTDIADFILSGTSPTL